MRVTHATLRMLGIDCLQPISATTAKTVVAGGVSYAMRYLENTTAAEIASCLAEGLALMFVSESRAAGWLPTAALGSTDGLRAATLARKLAIPAGMHLWCDLEQMSGSAADTIAYCKAWCAAVAAAGYLPGAYVGAGIPLNSSQLYGLAFVAYMHSLSEVPSVDVCGYMIIQLFPGNQTFPGTAQLVDYQVVQEDKKGRYPTLLAA